MVFVLSRKAVGKAKSVGKKPTKYYFIIPLVWFGVEIFTFLLIATGYRMFSGKELDPLVAAYLPATLMAFFSVVLLLNKIGKMGEEEPELGQGLVDRKGKG